MPEDDLERRVRELERTATKVETKLDNIERQVVAMQKTLELFYQEQKQKDEQMQAVIQRILQIELTQSSCLERQKLVTGFAASRLGSFVDWIFKAGVLAFLMYSVNVGLLK